jgi:dinuclear metal center YbgI/SA1388 family protein
MKVADVIRTIEEFAPLRLQESYDNAGLQVGNPEAEIDSALICIDVTEAVVDEAIEAGVKLILTHHPIIFKPLRSLSGKTDVERIVIRAIQNGIAIYSAHTNLDSVATGVSHTMARRLGLTDLRILEPKPGVEPEAGLGLVGELPEPTDCLALLERIKHTFGCASLRHSRPTGRPIKRVALCGGSGGSLIRNAIAAGADLYLTAEIRYHDYFGIDDRIVLADIGHFESEQFAAELLGEVVRAKYPELNVMFTKVNTNPIYYL